MKLYGQPCVASVKPKNGSGKKGLKKGKKINMEFKRNNQLYKNIYNPIYKRFIAASQILIDFLKYPFGDYFCYLF